MSSWGEKLVALAIAQTTETSEEDSNDSVKDRNYMPSSEGSDNDEDCDVTEDPENNHHEKIKGIICYCIIKNLMQSVLLMH
ncbi:hypothetical protein FQA39_LY01515 [Lamprigera yunnana]|nr:hypothetical protein FQA39_LY01515 [Lamprigera yunnana]